MLRGEITSFTQMVNLTSFIESFSTFSKENPIQFSDQTVFSGTLPHYRYTSLYYSTKICNDSGIPESPLDFYIKKKKNNQSNKFSLIQWLIDLIHTMKMTQVIKYKLDYLNLLNFGVEIEKKVKVKLIQWLENMISNVDHLNFTKYETDHFSVKDTKETEDFMKLVIEKFNFSFKKIIENRAKRFKQSYAIYAETKLLDDLDTLQKILCCNFLNGLDDALTELEKVDDASNSSNVNDITENIFDFSKESEDDEDEI